MMEQWNSEENIEMDIEKIREANRYKNVSLNKITYLAFITKYAPYSSKEIYTVKQADGSTKVLVKWENVLSSQNEGMGLSKAVEIITASYAGEQSIEEFETFKTTSRRRIKRFLDTLLGQKDCVKRFFSGGFSQLQASDLIHVLLSWESNAFQRFCDGKYEEIVKCEQIRKALSYPYQYFMDSFDFENDIVNYVYDFVIGGLEDQFNPQEISDLWHQKLDFSYEARKQRLNEEIKNELDNVKELIRACIDPRPQAEDIDAQLEFLNHCLRLIGALKEKIIDSSSYMKRIMAEEDDEFWKEIRQLIE